MSASNFEPDYLVSLLVDGNHRGTKRVTATTDPENPWHIDGHNTGDRFLATVHFCRGLGDVAATVDFLRFDPGNFLVNGGLTQKGRLMLDGHWLWKRKYDEPGEPATFAERASHVILTDLDDVPMPDWADLTGDPVAVVDHAIRTYMPECFHNVRCFWQFSSSTGFVAGKLGLHLFFWTEIPVWNSHVKAVLEPYKPIVCPAPYNAVQPFYIANPVVVGGVDPITNRTGWAGGTEATVVLPPAPVVQKARRARGTRGAPNYADVDAALAKLGRGEGGAGFHFPLRSAAWHYAGQCVRYGGRDDDAFKAKVLSLILDAERDSGDLEYYNEGYLQKAIDGAFRKRANEAGPQPCEPPKTQTIVDPDIASILVESVVNDFVAQAELTTAARQQACRDEFLNTWPVVPPVGETILVRAGLGVGKSQQGLDHTGAFLRTLATAGQANRLVVYVAPDHKLASDIERRFAQIAPGVPVFHYRGATQPDPMHRDFTDDSISEWKKTTMCRRAGMVADIVKAGGSVETLCGSAKRGYCPFHPASPESAANGRCGRRSTPMPTSGLVILAGPSVLTDAPPPGLERFITVPFTEVDDDGVQVAKVEKVPVDCCDLIIADEPKPLSWSLHSVMDLDALKEGLRPFQGYAWTDAQDKGVKRVQGALTAATEVLKDIPAGPLSAALLRRLSDICDWSEIRGLAFSLMLAAETLIRGDLDETSLGALVNQLALHRSPMLDVTKLADGIRRAGVAMAGRSDTAASGFLAVLPPAPKKGLSVCVSEPKSLHSAWQGLPTLLLDATGNADLLRRWFANIKVEADIQIPTPPCVVRRQIWNSAMGYTGWSPKNPTLPAPGAVLTQNETTVWNNLRWAMRLLTVRAAQFKGQGRDGTDVLCVAPKNTALALQNLFTKHGGKPAGIAFEHYNNLRGLDKYGSVRYQLLLSRVLPRVEALEASAAALTGLYGERVMDGRMLADANGAYLMRDTTGRLAKVVRHPDPLTESIRWQVSNAECIQAEGRTRANRRGADNPLLTEIATNLPLDIPIDELITREDLDDDANTASWLVACGVAPIPGSKGFAGIMGVVDGVSANAINERLYVDRSTIEPLEAVVSQPPAGWKLFKVRLVGGHYATPVLILADTVEQATTVLDNVGLSASKVTLDRSADKSKQARKPNVFEMMAERGVIFDRPSDALLAYPDLFVGRTGAAGTLASAQKVFQRQRSGTGGQNPSDLRFSPNKTYSFMEKTVSPGGFVHLFLTVRFRTKGPKQQNRTLQVAPERLPGLRDYLKLIFGEIGYYEVILPPSTNVTASDESTPPTTKSGGCGLAEQDPDDLDPTMPGWQFTLPREAFRVAA